MKNEETAKRLSLAMETAGIKAQELADRSGVSKASISQYLHGTYIPSNISAAKMGAVLDVNPPWLMGFDVPMEAKKDVVFNPSAEERQVLIAYRNLPAERKEVIRLILGIDRK